MISTCEHPACATLILTTAGAQRTRTCSAHAGQRPPEEDDAERLERVRREMGWRRVVVR